MKFMGLRFWASAAQTSKAGFLQSPPARVLRDVQGASVNDTRCCTLVGNINNTHKHTTGQGVSVKVAVRTVVV